MVGRATESIFYVNKINCRSLLDSGSMASTISVATLKSMHPLPDIITPDEFTLSVKVAEGSTFTLSWICRGKHICYLSVGQYDGSIIGCT
jgi:hypothetical protein